MSEYTIETRHLSRSFDQGPPVLNDLNLQVRRGSVYGFLGRNGSGKTTAIKILAGLMKADSGDTCILGGDPWSFGSSERQRLGYQSEKQTLPPMMKVGKLVNFCAQLYPAWDHAMCDGLLSRFQIAKTKRVNALSLGNQRMLGFILAVAPRPEVLLLDEPAANLDVVARREFLDEILELIREGKRTVFFSTHILSDVERVADEVGILAGGSLRVSAPLDDLKESIRHVRLYDFRGVIPTNLPEAYSYERDDREATAVMSVPAGDNLSALEARLQCRAQAHGLPLEDIFIHLAKNR